MNPVCVKCGRIMRVKRNGVCALEKVGPNARPYRIFYADLKQCPECEAEILSGFGLPIYPEANGFEELLKEVAITFW